MSWGHIVSKDLLTWTPASVSLALIPGQVYDRQGVFTGCWIPPISKTDQKLRVAYSSVKKLPFHWSTLPYPRNAAGLAIATSNDSGRTWEKIASNPILAGEPEGLAVTGFRDPYVTDLPALNEARGTEATHLYGTLAGGLAGVGPTLFLYELQPDNLGKWKYLGLLMDIPMRFQPSKKWSGNYGLNWECNNIMTLHAGSESRSFLIIGAEGDVEKDHIKRYRRPMEAPSRTVRSQLWISGHFNTTSGSVKFQYEHGGYLDNGSYYAANSFFDPPSGRRIVYGWIPEEDIPLEMAKKKGWNGSLAIPREICLLRIPGVLEIVEGDLVENSSFEIKNEADGSTTVLTLGVKPIREMTRLREACRQVLRLDSVVVLPQPDKTTQRPLFRTSTGCWELEATIAVYSGCETVGFHLGQCEDHSLRTTVTFSVINKSITVDRDYSNSDPRVNRCPDAGPFTLLKRQIGDEFGQPVLEKLQLRIFLDGNILEVFANDRFALATMIYSGCCCGKTELAAFATGNAKSTGFEHVTIWEGLQQIVLDATNII